MTGTDVDLSAVNGSAAGDAGIEHGAQLISFTEAVMGNDEETLQRERTALRALLTDEQFVDVAATIGAFNVVDRIADSTGIPLDEMMKPISADLRRELNLQRFASSANTTDG